MILPVLLMSCFQISVLSSRHGMISKTLSVFLGTIFVIYFCLRLYSAVSSSSSDLPSSSTIWSGTTRTIDNGSAVHTLRLKRECGALFLLRIGIKYKPIKLARGPSHPSFSHWTPHVLPIACSVIISNTHNKGCFPLLSKTVPQHEGPWFLDQTRSVHLHVFCGSSFSSKYKMAPLPNIFSSYLNTHRIGGPLQIRKLSNHSKATCCDQVPY